MEKVRYVDYQREIAVERVQVSYNALTPKLEPLADGTLPKYEPEKVRLRAMDAVRLVRTYTHGRFMEQVQAVVPLALYLVLFQLLILRQMVEDSWIITVGLFEVIIGLMLFMEGLKLGLMPFGEVIGNTLPKKSPLPLVLLVALLLGVGVTFAEPAIGALKAAGQIVQVEKAPYLYALLNQWSEILVMVVGGGVGFAAVLGTLRFIYGWSLKPMIYCALTPALGLTIYAYTDPELYKIIGLAWDCGAVTTGPVTVPLVLSLGIGIAAAAGKGENNLSGFGIVTLASLFPIIGVLGLGTYVRFTTDPQAIIDAASQAVAVSEVATELAWYETSPGLELVMGVRAIMPLVIFLVLVLKVLLRAPMHHAGVIAYGIGLAVLGMVVFSLGLTYGLSKLGEQSGGLVPAAFMGLDNVAESPLYIYAVGLMLALAFAWALGFGATLAEPALNALGVTVENLTNGVFKKSTLMIAVSVGVACGIALGLAKIIFDLPLAWLLIPLYLLSILFTFFSTEEYVNIAWDSAGVTTGPITVPLVLAMGLGFGNAMGAVEGFGILSMASIGPILSVMATGLWVQYREKRQAAEDEADWGKQGAEEATA
ncbi:MAG: DUF1538 domain-containing protein [Myxococcota bacterium]|nr:DUF1538 domain-containing protein [Myxococcota bacterium]